MKYTVEIIGDLMNVMDEDGNVLDVVSLKHGLRTCRAIIRVWASWYTIDVADAYRRLTEYFTNLEDA